MKDLEPCILELNKIFEDNGFAFIFCILANKEFNDKVLQPILKESNGIADTTELFLRSYQLLTMFSDEHHKKKPAKVKAERMITTGSAVVEDEYISSDYYCEFKIGQLAQLVLGRMLREGCASDLEVELMQTAEYSKTNFGLQYPLLQKYDGDGTVVHYYANPLTINGVQYRMCCEWFEKEGANNDRPYLLRWIAQHSK